MRPQTQYKCDMCQMPTASRADCTQVDLEQEFEFVYDGTAFSAKLMRINIDFNACQGIDRLGRQDNNDLLVLRESSVHGRQVYGRPFDVTLKEIGWRRSKEHVPLRRIPTDEREGVHPRLHGRHR